MMRFSAAHVSIETPGLRAFQWILPGVLARAQEGCLVDRKVGPGVEMCSERQFIRET
jgi:hypothetical protein